VERLFTLREPASMSILKRVPGHAMLVMTATTKPFDAAEIMDDAANAVLSEAHCTVLAVRSRRQATFPFQPTNQLRMAQVEPVA
jgi:hypothetical protein